MSKEYSAHSREEKSMKNVDGQFDGKRQPINPRNRHEYVKIYLEKTR